MFDEFLSNRRMTGLKYYERTKLLIELIEKRNTGSSGDLAGKLGLKERMIYNLVDDLRHALGKEISYCKEEKSYIFSEKK
jgi:transcriptional antiterminator